MEGSPFGDDCLRHFGTLREVFLTLRGALSTFYTLLARRLISKPSTIPDHAHQDRVQDKGILPPRLGIPILGRSLALSHYDIEDMFG